MKEIKLNNIPSMTVGSIVEELSDTYAETTLRVVGIVILL